MKKLIFLFAGLMLMVSLQAQDATLRLKNENSTYLEYLTDHGVGNGADVWYKVISDQDMTATQAIYCNLDSLKGGSMTTTVALYGSIFGTTWVQIGSTVTWKATTGDTTIQIANATANRYRFYKVNFHVASGDSVRVDYLKFKLWRE